MRAGLADLCGGVRLEQFRAEQETGKAGANERRNDEEPELTTKCPGGALVQDDAEAPENEPEEQLRHTDEAELEKVPAEQAVHEVAAAAENEPAEQAVNEEAPLLVLK